MEVFIDKDNYIIMVEYYLIMVIFIKVDLKMVIFITEESIIITVIIQHYVH